MAEPPLWVGAPVFRLPWNGSRPRCAAAGLLLTLVAWPVAGGRVTLFLGGRFIRKFPDLAQRLVAEGQEIASYLDTRDWVADTSSRIYRSRDEIATRILEFGGGSPGALNGGIILRHLNTLRQTDRPYETLPHLLKSLQAQGYRLVPVSTLLAHSGEHHAGAAPHAAPRPSPKVEALIR